MSINPAIALSTFGTEREFFVFTQAGAPLNDEALHTTIMDDLNFVLKPFGAQAVDEERICQVEINTRPYALVEMGAYADDCASMGTMIHERLWARHGVLPVFAGTVPYVAPNEAKAVPDSSGDRYRIIGELYDSSGVKGGINAHLKDGYLICGTHYNFCPSDATEDEKVQVVRAMFDYVPLFAALTACSPDEAGQMMSRASKWYRFCDGGFPFEARDPRFVFPRTAAELTAYNKRACAENRIVDLPWWFVRYNGGKAGKPPRVATIEMRISCSEPDLVKDAFMSCFFAACCWRELNRLREEKRAQPEQRETDAQAFARIRRNLDASCRSLLEATVEVEPGLFMRLQQSFLEIAQQVRPIVEQMGGEATQIFDQGLKNVIEKGPPSLDLVKSMQAMQSAMGKRQAALDHLVNASRESVGLPRQTVRYEMLAAQ